MMPRNEEIRQQIGVAQALLDGAGQASWLSWGEELMPETGARVKQEQEKRKEAARKTAELQGTGISPEELATVQDEAVLNLLLSGVIDKLEYARYCGLEPEVDTDGEPGTVGDAGEEPEKEPNHEPKGKGKEVRKPAVVDGDGDTSDVVMGGSGNTKRKRSPSPDDETPRLPQPSISKTKVTPKVSCEK